jgi:nicotinate-nucleotide adenylyltransferase
VLGGTFDPIHEGHLAIATAAADELSLDRVMFVPAGDPYLRPGPSAGVEDRTAMVRLAIQADRRFELSTVDVERPGKSYTVDTLSDLRSEQGQATRFYFIVGVDAAVSMSQWRNAGRIPKLAMIVVIGRPGHLPGALKVSDHPASDALFLVGPNVPTSASEIRSRLAAGHPITGLTPPDVISYIDSHSLYTGG